MGDVARYVFRIGKDGLGYYLDLGPFAVGDANGDADASMLRSTDRAPRGADPCRPQSAPPFRSRYPEGSAHLPPSAPIGPGAADVAIQLVSATGRFRSAAVIVSAGTETHVYRPTRKAAATPANDESCMQTGCSRDKSSQKSSLSRPISPAATLRSRPNSRQSVRRAEGHGRSARSPRAAHDSAGVQIGACCSTRAAAAA